jgi:hypothetical protein
MRPLMRCGLLENPSLVNTLQVKGLTYGLCFALATNQIGLAALVSVSKHSIGLSGVRFGFRIASALQIAIRPQKPTTYPY